MSRKCYKTKHFVTKTVKTQALKAKNLLKIINICNNFTFILSGLRVDFAIN